MATDGYATRHIRLDRVLVSVDLKAIGDEFSSSASAISAREEMPLADLPP